MGLQIPAGKTHPVFGNRVRVWGWNLGISLAEKFAVTEVVGQENNNVGAARLRLASDKGPADNQPKKCS